MFKRIEIHLRGPICSCDAKNLSWGVPLVNGRASLKITCETCKVIVEVPPEQFKAAYVLETLYPADRKALQEQIAAKRKADAAAEAQKRADAAAKKTKDEAAVASAETLLTFEDFVTFDDVAGIDEAVAATRQLVRFLSNPEKYARLSAKMPRGYLFHGLPGTGKTLLARAVAGEAGVHFQHISGSEFVEKWVGMGAKRVRELFSEARKNGTSIIFIDEIDSVGGKRTGDGGGSREHDQTLNQLLVEMDGFTKDDNIVVIAATNQVDLLDSALLRPGRLTRKIEVPMPDEIGRRKILDVHTRLSPLALDVDLPELAQVTDGWTGADLANLVNEAAILAAEADQDEVTQKDFLEAKRIIVAGGDLVANKKRRIIGFGASA